METLGILNYIWYLLLFPIIALFVKNDKEVPILFSVIVFANHLTFDTIGVDREYWFLWQAYYSLVFSLACLLISNSYLRWASSGICLYIAAINLGEHFSTYATMFYDWWEIMNWIAFDLLAACVILNNKIVGKNVQSN